MEQNNKNILILLGVYIISRILFSLSYIKNTFIGTNIPYPIQPDPYYYYLLESNTPVWVTCLGWMLIFIACIIMFYGITTLFFDKKRSLYCSILFILCHYIVLMSYIGYTDTPPFILFCLLSVAMLFLMFWKTKSFIGLIIYPIWILLTNLLIITKWSGYPIFLFIETVSFVLFFVMTKYKSRWLYIITSIPLLISLPYMFHMFKEYLRVSNTISELQPTFNPCWLLLLLFFAILVIDNYKKILKNESMLYITINALLLAGMGFLMQRWIYLAIPFILIVIFEYSKNYNKNLNKFLFIAFLLLNIVYSLITFINVDPIMSNDFQEQLENLKCDTLLLGSWSRGHIYKYFSCCDVKFSAYPSGLEEYTYLLKNNISDICQYYSEPDCYIVTTPREDLLIEEEFKNKNGIYRSGLYNIYYIEE